MSQEAKRFFTLPEYFALVKESEARYEFWNGEVFLMTGASPAQVFITDNLLTLLKNRLAGTNCRPMGSDMQIKVPAAPPFRYADISVGCGQLDFEDIGGIKALTNPVLIIEVLSLSTERFDRTAKFTYYQSIKSFSEYLLVSQEKPSIIQHIKQPNGEWHHQEINGIEHKLSLASISISLELRNIYEGIEF